MFEASSRLPASRPLDCRRLGEADGGTRTPDPIITSQPIAPHARLPVRTPAHESPGPGRKPIGRTQARVRRRCQAEGPRKDPTRWARHAASSRCGTHRGQRRALRRVPLPCPRCGHWRARCAPHQTARRENTPRRPVARVRRRSAAKASAPSASGDARAFRPTRASDARRARRSHPRDRSSVPSPAARSPAYPAMGARVAARHSVGSTTNGPLVGGPFGTARMTSAT